MQLDIDFELENEELTIVLDDASVLKASLDSAGELKLNRAFTKLGDENPGLYTMLRKVVSEIFKFSD